MQHCCVACGGLQAAKPARLMHQYHSNFADLAEGETTGQRMFKGTFRCRAKHQSREVAARAKERKRPAVGTLAQTRNLILAALRVWELKQGIRDW